MKTIIMQVIRFTGLTSVWGPFILGAVFASIIPWWIVLIFAKIGLPAMVVSGFSYLMLAKSGKTAALFGVQTAVVIALFLALPTFIG